MGVAGGPKISRDGLVFGYDTNYGVADKKIPTRFYPGVPAVNCAPGVVPTTGIGDGAWVTTEITDGSITPPRKGARVFKLVAGSTGNLYRQSSYYGGGGFSSNNPQNSLLLGRTSPSNFTTVGTNKYKYGFWVRGDSSNGASDAISIDVADRGGSSRTIGTSTEWYFISADDSLGSNSSSYPYDFFDLFSSNQNMIIYISDFGIYRSPGTVDSLPALQSFPQFIEYGQTRSSTQSLIDLTRTSTIDVSNVSFDSNGLPTFDGTDDYISLGDNSTFDFTNGVFSIEAIIKFPSSWTGGSQYPNIISKGASAGWDTDGWALFGFRDYPSSGQKSWGLGIRNGSTNRIVYIANRTTDVYLHVVATLDGSTMRLYENGSQVNTNTQTINPASNSTNVYIGRDPSSQYFPGNIPTAKLYNRALSADEVQQNYNAYKNRFNL